MERRKHEEVFVPAAVLLLLLVACSMTGKATPAPSSGMCGDGVLDALEQANPGLCPQDASASEIADAAYL